MAIQHIVLPINGLNHYKAITELESTLKAIDFIEDLKLDTTNNTIEFSSPKLFKAAPKVYQALDAVGLTYNFVEESYPILGMTCASCATSSQANLKRQSGVVDAEVNYANGQGKIKYIPTLTSPEQLKSALQGVGYDLVIPTDSEHRIDVEALQIKKHQQLKTNVTWSVILGIPLFIIGMFFMDMPYANYIMWALATPILFIFGKQFFIGAWQQLQNKSANMDTLVALSTSVAYIFSVFNTLFPEFWTARGIHGHVYFEAAGIIIVFILLGKLLEENAKGNTSSAIKKLIGLQPNTVQRIAGGQTVEVKINEVVLGDILLAKPGEKIAVDGRITQGASFFDESSLTGEPIAVEKTIDELVFAGTINQNQAIQYEAVKVGKDTVLAQIIQAVQNAQGSKAPVQKLVDKIAGIFVPIVLVIAVLTLVTWLIFGQENAFTLGLLAMITVLVIACPCALGLATPTAIMVGMGKGAEQGILIKNAESLELANKIDVMILDKTGTITEGKPKVQELVWLETGAEAILSEIEKNSHHPLAKSIVDHLGVQTAIASIEVNDVSGKGLKAVHEGTTYYVGKLDWIEELGLCISEEHKALMNTFKTKNYTTSFFGNDQKVLALIGISDQIKESSTEAIRQFHAKGIEVYMVTGDNENSAKHIASLTGIDHVVANALPEDKMKIIQNLQEQGKIVAMVGDGINDSAALAQANVSVAMGNGSDIAIDVAQITLIGGDLTKIVQAINLSHHTVKTIRQNLFWAFIYNVIGIPIAAGVLYPINGFLLDPMIAGAAMALSSVSVVSNSLLLKYKKI